MSDVSRLPGPMDHAFWLGSVIFDGGRAIKGVAPDLDRLPEARTVATYYDPADVLHFAVSKANDWDTDLRANAEVVGPNWLLDQLVD